MLTKEQIKQTLYCENPGEHIGWRKEKAQKCVAIIRVLHRLKPHIMPVTVSGGEITVGYVISKGNTGVIRINAKDFPNIVIGEIIKVLSKKQPLKIKDYGH